MSSQIKTCFPFKEINFILHKYCEMIRRSARLQLSGCTVKVSPVTCFLKACLRTICVFHLWRVCLFSYMRDNRNSWVSLAFVSRRCPSRVSLGLELFNCFENYAAGSCVFTQFILTRRAWHVAFHDRPTRVHLPGGGVRSLAWRNPADSGAPGMTHSWGGPPEARAPQRGHKHGETERQVTWKQADTSVKTEEDSCGWWTWTWSDWTPLNTRGILTATAITLR